jgi:ATP-dependent exoDNAse (exonuclease V) beta subunit
MSAPKGSPEPAFVDADARTAIAVELDETFVVEAAAGTGKTTELVNRIVQVLASGRAAMDAIVAVTFTEKAAGELKLRLRTEIEHARSKTADAAVRDRFERALETFEEAHVSTIHGFCAELLRERPVEAGVDPLFAVLTDAQAERWYASAFRSWLEAALADPPEGVRRALRRTSGPSFGGLDDSGPIERLRGAGWTLAGVRDFTHPWTREPFDRVRAIGRLVESLHRLATLSAHGTEKDNLFKSLERVRRESRQIELEAELKGEDLDAWEARLVDLVRDNGLAKTKKGYGAKYGSVTRTDVLSARDAFYADLLQFRSDADADLAALLQQELQAPIARYQELKRRQGGLDFVDLLACTRDLLRANHGVRRDLQNRFDRIFVDEFQDTDPLQAEILLLLSADDHRVDDWTAVSPRPGKLFIVGDPKQAIYRFRGADVGTYWRVRRQLENCGGGVLQLTTNFRSVPAIQQFVNRAFEGVMRADTRSLQAEYIPLAERRPSDDSQPAIVALPVPKPYSEGRAYGNNVTMRAIEESLPDAVGGLIEWLVRDSGWHVSERAPDGKSEQRVPVSAKHIAVLFRRFVRYTDDLTRPYVEALEARGISHLLVGGKAFHDREEVETMRAALAAIEWPDDELSVFATIRGSLFAIDDEMLLEYRHRFGAFHPFRIPPELGGASGGELALSGEPVAHLMPIATTLRLIRELHQRRNDRPVADTVARLLDATRAHVGFMLRQGGEQALANVLHIAELARQYEAEGGISFRGFIAQLREAAEDTTAAEAPIVEDGADGVRLMTAHKAKGLEFPVVILADMTCQLSRDEASRYIDADRGLYALKLKGWAPRDLVEHEEIEIERERAEGVRLAYVAATRARDLLIVPAIGDAAWDGGWLEPLNSAIYPPLGRRQTPARAAGCPPNKSKDSVKVRPDDRLPHTGTVAPGLHVFDSYSVVWLDPRWLTLDLKAGYGVRRQELIAKEAPREVVESGRRAYDAWCADREAARAGGSKVSLAVATARELAARDSVSPVPQVRILAAGPPSDRAGGAAFGVLVHAVLSDIALDAPAQDVLDVARAHGRVLAAADRDIEDAVAAVTRALSHDLFARARAADAKGRCRRETPVAHSLVDGTLVEGIVDLAFEENGRWVVVDLKTDRDISLQVDAYARQVQIYADAIAAATGKQAEAVLLRV